MALINCPNKSHEDWKYSVSKLGEDKTLFIYDKTGDIPTKDVVDELYAAPVLANMSFQEVENVSNLILNKLLIKSKPFLKRDRSKIKDDFWYKSPSDLAYATAQSLLEDIVGKNIAQGISYSETIEGVKAEVAELVNNDIESMWRDELEHIEKWNPNEDLNKVYQKRAVISEFARRGMDELSSFSPSDQKTIREYFKSLFNDNKYKTPKQAMFMASKIAKEKINKELQKAKSVNQLANFKRSKLIGKYQTLVNLSQVDANYKQRIIDKVNSEIDRVLAFQQSEIAKNPNIPNVLKFRELYRQNTELEQAIKLAGRAEYISLPQSALDLFPNLELNHEGKYGIGSSTSSKILTVIANGNSRYAKLANQLLPYTKNNSVPVYLQPGIDREGVAGYNETWLKHYKENGVEKSVVTDNEIYIDFNSDHFKADPERILLHEIVHSLTAIHIRSEIYKNSEAGKDNPLTVYMNYIKDKTTELRDVIRPGSFFFGDFSQPYGFANETEFVAEILSNQDFQELLKAIPSMDENKFKNLFEEILAWIAEIFGIGHKSNAFEQLYDLAIGFAKVESEYELYLPEAQEYFRANQTSNYNTKLSNNTIFNKKAVIESFSTEVDPSFRDEMSLVFARLSDDEFDEMAVQSGFTKIGKYWTLGTISSISGEDNVEFSNTNPESLNDYNLKLYDFLKTFGFTLEQLDDLKEVTGYNIIGATDFLEKTIFVKKENLNEAYSKEAAYVIFNLLGKKNILRKDLLASIHLIDNYDKLRSTYINSKLSEYKIKELIAADYLKSKLIEAHKEALQPTNKYKSIDATAKTKLEYTILMIKKWWNDIIRNFFKTYKKGQIDSMFNEIANNVINNNTTLFNVPSIQKYSNLKLNAEQSKINSIIISLGAINSGSYALSKQGTVIRESVHDLDYFIPYNIRDQFLDNLFKRFPNAVVSKPYSGVMGKRSMTLSMSIDNVQVDFFLPMSHDESNYNRVIIIDNIKYHHWKNIFDAKIRIGNKKHLSDLATFVPFQKEWNIFNYSWKAPIKIEEKPLSIIGQRHYNFDFIQSKRSPVYNTENPVNESLDIKNYWDTDLINTALKYFKVNNIVLMDSELYKDMLSYFENVDKATIAYYLTFSENFKKFYGNIESRKNLPSFLISKVKGKYSKDSVLLDNVNEPVLFYHGAGTIFDKFSKDYFLTGEGAMAYGAGFYATNYKPTADSYRDTAKAAMDTYNKLIAENDERLMSLMDQLNIPITEQNLISIMKGSFSMEDTKSKTELLNILGLTETKALYISLTNPIYWEKNMSQDNINLIEKSFNIKLTNRKGGMIYKEIMSLLSITDKELSSRLYQIGIDGVLRVAGGGMAVGGFSHKAGELHAIFFEPIQAKSILNSGLFSLNNENMYDPIEIETKESHTTKDNSNLITDIHHKPSYNSRSWQEIIYTISNANDISEIENALLGYKGAINSKKYNGSIYIKEVKPESLNYIKIVEDLIAKIDTYYPGVVSTRWLSEASKKAGRGVWIVEVNKDVFERYKKKADDSAFEQGVLFKRDPREIMSELISDDREATKDFFNSANEVTDALEYLTLLSSTATNISTEHKDLINLILTANDYIPNLKIKQINESEVGKYFDTTADPTIGESFGLYKNGTIYIIKNRINSDYNPMSMLIGTLTHEILHGVTLDVIDRYEAKESLTDKERDFVDNLKQLYKKAKSLTTNPYHNAWSSLREFVADGLTDQKVIDELKTMNSGERKKSLWDKIKEFFLKLFNVEYTTGSYYHNLLSAVTDYIYTPKKSLSAVMNIQARKMADNTFVNKDNPTHRAIVEALTKIEEGYNKQPKRFHGPTTLMKMLKLGGVPNSMMSEEDKAEQEKNTGPGTALHFHVQKNFQTAIKDISLKYHLTESAKQELNAILSKFKKDGVTILSEVRVVNYAVEIAGTIDLVIIDKDNKVHLFDVKTKKAGFKNFGRRFGPKVGEAGFVALSAFEQAQIQLSVYADLWRKNTNTDVASMNVIPLKSTVDDTTKEVSAIEIDRSFSSSDLIDIPRTNHWLKLIYGHSDLSFDFTDSADVLSSSEVLDAMKEISKLDKDKEAMLASQLNVPEKYKYIHETEVDIYNRLVKAIEHRIEVMNKQSRGEKLLADQLKYLKEVKKLAKKDVEEALKLAVRIAHSSIKNAKKELDTLEESKVKVPAATLRRLVDTVKAYDDLAGFQSILSDRFGTAGPTTKGDKEVVKLLDEALKNKKLIEIKYKNIGLDILTDFLYPMYTKIKAEFKDKYAREYRLLKHQGKLENPNITEKDYIESKLVADNLDVEARTKEAIRKELKKAGSDISTLSSWLDTVLDSPDATLGALAKKFVTLDDKARIEVEARRLSMLIELNKCQSYLSQFGSDFRKAYDFMLERDLDTKELTGHIVTSFPSRLIKEYRLMMQATEDIDDEIDDSSEYQEFEGLRSMLRREWKDANMPLDKDAFFSAYFNYIKGLMDDGKITANEFENLDASFRSVGKKIKVEDMLRSGTISQEAADLTTEWLKKNSIKFRTPSKEWKNPQWESLSNILKDENDPRSILYNMITKAQEEADDLVPSSVKVHTRLPGIIKQKYERIAEGQNLWEVTKRSFGKSLSVRVDDTNRVHTDIVDADGAKKYFIPVHFSTPVTKVIEEEGRKVEVFDPEEQSFDLPNLYFNFLSSAIDFSWKVDILPTLEIYKDIINDREVVTTTALGKVKYRASRIFGVREEEGNEVVIKGGNIAKQYEAWLTYALYGQVDKDLGVIPGTKIDVAKLINVLQQYTALNLLGFNVMAGVANLGLGEVIQAIEAFSGQFMSAKDYHNGQMFYAKNLGGILGDIESRQPKNVVSLLLKEFNVLHDPKVGNLTHSRFQEMVTTDSAFFVSHAGEHKIQTPFLLGMLSSRRAYNSKGEDIGSILDLYEVKDGKLWIDPKTGFDEKKSNWTEDERRVFEHKVRRILARMHGIYSDLDRVMLQANAFGSMVYMFRKFVVPGFKRRWGSRRYEEGIEEFVEGDYRTVINFTGKLIKNLKAKKALMMSDEWAQLTEMEKANVYRALGEVVALIMVMVIASIALGLRDDDDKDKRSWNFIAYQALRIKSELLFFISPSAAMQILRSPAAGISMTEDVIKLTTQVFGSGYEDYQQGPWKDHMKIEKTLVDLTIGAKQYYKLRDINEIVDLWNK